MWLLLSLPFLLACASASADGVFKALHADSQEIVGRLISPFIPGEHLRICDGDFTRILMSMAWLSGKVDPVETLMAQLGTAERLIAVKHFINYNQPELRALSRRILYSHGSVCILGLQLTSVVPPDIAQLIYDLVLGYVQSRDGRCMYDHVPMEFRDTHKYDAMFTELDGVSQSRSTPGDVEGVLMYVDSDSFLSHQGGEVFRDPVTGMFRVERDDATTFVTNTCAATLKIAYRGFHFYPGLRSVAGVTEDVAYIWRADSVVPVTIPFSRDSRFGFVASYDAVYFAYTRGWLDARDPIFSVDPVYRGGDACVKGLLMVLGVLSRAVKVPVKLNLPGTFIALEEDCVDPHLNSYNRVVDRQFGTLYEWEQLALTKSEDMVTSAIVSSHVTRFFDDLEKSRISLEQGGRFLLLRYPSLTSETFYIMKCMFGMLDAAATSAYRLTENQQTLAKVVELMMKRRFLEGWRLVPAEWFREWKRDFAVMIARET